MCFENKFHELFSFSMVKTLLDKKAPEHHSRRILEQHLAKLSPDVQNILIFVHLMLTLHSIWRYDDLTRQRDIFNSNSTVNSVPRHLRCTFQINRQKPWVLFQHIAISHADVWLSWRVVKQRYTTPSNSSSSDVASHWSLTTCWKYFRWKLFSDWFVFI